MATLTKVLVGRIGDALSSAATAITDEHFTSAFDTWVYAAHPDFTRGSVLTRKSDNTVTYTVGVDYQIDYRRGAIKVLSGGTMLDATAYHVSYTYPDSGLAAKVNAVTSAANTAGKTIYAVAMTQISPHEGAAVIVYQA
jgi:hypothetical protein